MWIAMGYLNDYTIKSMNEWMNDILSKNWLTISRHYSQPMICKSVTRISFIQSILFYSIHSYNHIWFTLVWMADWMIESTNKSMNEWMNERFSLCGVIHKTTKTFITTNELSFCINNVIDSIIQSIIHSIICSCF